MAVWGPYGRISSNTLRLLTLDDAPVLVELLRVNRDFLTPWEPIRGGEYFTVDGQHANIRDASITILGCDAFYDGSRRAGIPNCGYTGACSP
jgi:hypothetical protein